MRRIQRVAAYNVCVDPDDRILLARLSARTEAAGAWSLPGGGLDFGETPEAGAIRELREETGLDGRVVELLNVDSVHYTSSDADGDYEYYSVRIYYRTEIVGGTLTDERDESTDAARWFARDELARIRLVKTAAVGANFAFGPAPF